MTAPTMYPDMPDAEYRALPGLSGTGVVKLLRSPALYRHSVDNPTPGTDAMRVGRAFHALVLERMEPRVSPFDSFRTAEARAWRDANPDALTSAEAEQVMDMALATFANDDAEAILNAPGQSEVTVTWEHEGYPMKGRIDRLVGGLVVDLKTTADFDGFDRELGRWGIPFQMQHYRNGINVVTGVEPPAPVLIVAEKDFPHRVKVVELSPDDIELAERGCAAAYRIFADCTEAGVWPDGSPDGVQMSNMPRFQRSEWEARIEVVGA